VDSRINHTIRKTQNQSRQIYSFSIQIIWKSKS
jgi:hypothetical protein